LIKVNGEVHEFVDKERREYDEKIRCNDELEEMRDKTKRRGATRRDKRQGEKKKRATKRL